MSWVQLRLSMVSDVVLNTHKSATCRKLFAYQSVACQDKTRDAAKMASDVSREKVPIAS